MGIGKGDILVVDIEELEKMDASEIYPGRLNAKEVLITHKDGEFVFLVADGSATSTPHGERISAENLKALGENFNLKKQDDAETREDSRSSQGDSLPSSR